MNDEGDIIGWYRPELGGSEHGFLHSAGGYRDLGDEVTPLDINVHREVVGDISSGIPFYEKRPTLSFNLRDDVTIVDSET